MLGQGYASFVVCSLYLRSEAKADVLQPDGSLQKKQYPILISESTLT